MDRPDILIVGSGHGGAQAAISLRDKGFRGSIMILGKESHLPYERPPLSKEYFSGRLPFERLLIRPDSYWRENAITLKYGAEVVEIDPSEKTVIDSKGTKIPYGRMIWSAGASPRPLSCPGGDLPGVQTLRYKADADALRTKIEDGARRIVVIGGGYIGLEAAAVLRKFGCEVILLEAQKRLLSRTSGEIIASFFEDEHRKQGVDVRTSTMVRSIEAASGAVTGVSLETGETISCDAVVVGIGVSPNVGPLVRAGAAAQDGVKVDSLCRTSLPDVYAIGDCASRPLPFSHLESLRLESVPNAQDMADIVASEICGEPSPVEKLPWFWSDQYDLQLKTVGVSAGHDACVVRGKRDERNFSVIYLRNGTVIAFDCINRPREFFQGRKYVGSAAPLEVAKLADEGQPLGDLLSVAS